MDFRFPDKPSVATPESVAKFRSGDFIGQWKYDGWHVEIIKHRARVEVLTRVGRSILDIPGAKFPKSLIESLNGLDIPEDSVLSGEYVGPRGKHEPAIYLFDSLAYAGKWLTFEPFKNRWDRCQKFKLPNGIKLARSFGDSFLDEFNKLKNEWNHRQDMSLTEGIVLKSKCGNLTLSRTDNVKSNCQFKLKFRDIRSQRY